MEVRRADIADAVTACNSGHGVIILTDMFGGTPSNLAISLLGPQVEVIAGVNLPMLIKLASVRKTGTVAAAVQAAQDAGRKYIAVASRMLGEAA
jgi:PTS system mannose-specific IIA component